MADKRHVVVLDDDRDVAEVIQTILLDEGFAVSCLYGPDDAAFGDAIEHLSPVCVILDGAVPRADDPWRTARSLAMRTPAIPTVLLTGGTDAREEAMLGESERAKSSLITATVPKPFDIDQLLIAVRNAMGATAPTEQSRKAARGDTARLLVHLRAAGAVDLRTSNAGREWVTFRATPNGDLFKVYRWQTAGSYFIGRYAANGDQLHPLGQIADTDAAIAYCERVIDHERAER
jgi:FixJ family two-component response regulator